MTPSSPSAAQARISPSVTLPRQPVVVEAERGIATGASVRQARAGAVRAARVRVLVVTWNRRTFVENILRSLSRQSYPVAAMDVTVIDNASTDGTLEHLCGLFRPERVVHNRTEEAHRPNFQPAAGAAGDERGDGLGGAGGANTLGFGSLTIIRNQSNLGGCGGFNTGFGYTEWLAAKDAETAPEYLWLVDDDADVPEDALEQLTRAMQSSSDIGLVGCRTVNIADRRTTIETTIYYNFWTGAMQDDCPPENPKRESWEAWVEQTGGTRGELEFHGLMDVDVVSACSMLARWRAVVGDPENGVRGVGFWDWRYFIYCDDADWCLRFAKAGWRVVLNLDAVVYHTPWNLKLTPARIYYANRNKVWMGQKVLRGAQLRIVSRRAMWSILKDSLKAAVHRRLFHASIILDTARDIASGRTGKSASDGPSAEPVPAALRRLGLARNSTRLAVLCSHADSARWLEELRSHLRESLEPDSIPELVPVFRNDVREAPVGSIIYGRHRASRLKKQIHLWRRRPSGAIVFEQTNDMPLLLRGGWNLHIDRKQPTMAQVERDGWAPRLRFLLRWIPTAGRCLFYACTIRPYTSPDKYG